MNKDTFDKVYENYKLRDDTVKIIDNIKYYRIIDKSKVHQFNIIVLPNSVYYNSNRVLRDENGNIIELGVPISYSFSNGVPQWYFEVIHTVISIDIDNIGDYVTLINKVD